MDIGLVPVCDFFSPPGLRLFFIVLKINTSIPFLFNTSCTDVGHNMRQTYNATQESLYFGTVTVPKYSDYGDRTPRQYTRRRHYGHVEYTSPRIW